MKKDFISKMAIEFIGNTFMLTESFKNDILLSSNVGIVTLSGPARSGKSTQANILLNPVLPKNKNDDLNGIFKADEGNVPVTHQILYVKTKLSTLTRNYHLADPDFDIDLFILDCEGIDSLGKTTQNLRKAIFTVLQISTVNLYVTKTLDKSNIYDLKAFFSLPKLIPGSNLKLTKKNGIILPNIGVPGNFSEKDFEKKRKENDLAELGIFLSNLREKHIKFTRDNTAVFAQPKWRDEKHYFESVKDLVRFIVSGFSQTAKIPGKMLVDIFDKSIKVISKIDELDDSDIRLEKIIDNLITSYFQEAYDYTIQRSQSFIQNNIKTNNAMKLIDFAKQNDFELIQNHLISIFKEKSNDILEDLTNIFPEKYAFFSKKIKKVIKKNCTGALEQQCISIVIPFISDKLLSKEKEKNRIYFNNIQTLSIFQIDKTNEIANFQKSINSEFFKQIHSILPSLTSSIEFNTEINNIQIIIVKETSKNYDRRLSDANIIINAQNALDEYQRERKKYEIQIYEVFRAILPQKQGGMPRGVRERMEAERNEQGRKVSQLRQKYNMSIQKLDERAKMYQNQNERELSNEFINKKSQLLNQELRNRKERIIKLDNEISIARRPRKEGGLYREHREELESLGSKVRKEVNDLEQLINQY